MWYKYQMRLTLKVFCLSLLAVALLAGSATSFASQSTNIGKGTKRCVPEPGADCRGVVERWTVEYHGDLRKAKFTGAVLPGADFRGADLRGADFRGAKLRHADFTGANLKGARFDPVKRTGKNTKQGNTQSSVRDWWVSTLTCTVADLEAGTATWSCDQADLTGANLSYANLTGADMMFANLTDANLTGANLTGAMLGGATGCSTVYPFGTLTAPPCTS